MAAWNEAPAAGGMGECAALVRSAEALRSSAPELAVQLARRALAMGAEPAESADLGQVRSLSMRAQAVLATGLVRINHYAEAVDPAFTALALAEDEGVTDLATVLRLDLAACSPEVGEPLLGCELLRPVLESTRSSPAVRAVALGRLVGCVAHIGRRDDVEDVLTEADRLLSADDALSPDLRRLERAQLSVRTAAYHRWYGDTEDAAEAAREGLTQLNRLRGLRPETARLRARLVLELACALLDDGALDEAASVSESVLAEPVRATSADAVGRLMLAVSTRVYLPAGRVERGRGLLDQAVWVAGRHGLDDLLADVLTAVSQLDEAAERPVEALESLRIARAAEKRRLRGISLATRRLLTEASPAKWDTKAVNALLRSVVRTAEAEPVTEDWRLAAQRVTQPPNRAASPVQTGQQDDGQNRHTQGDRPAGWPAGAFSAGELVAPTIGQSPTGQSATERSAADRAAAAATADQAAGALADAGRPAAGQAAEGQGPAGQAVAAQPATGQPTAGHTAAGQSAAGQVGAGQPPAGQAAAERATVEQTAAGQTAAGHLTAKQAAAEHARGGQAASASGREAGPPSGEDLAVPHSAARSDDLARSNEKLDAWSKASDRPAGELVSAVVDRMQDQTEIDAATGLLNKDGLIRRLRAVRNGDRPVALTLVRLDGYTGSVRFADPGTSPNAAADFELSELAGQVRDIAPEDAELARSDGSELAVLLPHTTRDQAERFAAAIESTWLGTTSGHGISTGVVQSNPDAPTVDARALINAARHALTPAVGAPNRSLPPSPAGLPEIPGDPGDTLRVGRAIISSLSVPAGSGGKRRVADDPDPSGEPPAHHPDEPAAASAPPTPAEGTSAATPDTSDAAFGAAIRMQGAAGVARVAFCPTDTRSAPGSPDSAFDSPTVQGAAGATDSAAATSDMAGTAEARYGAPDTASASPAVWGTASGTSDATDSAPATPTGWGTEPAMPSGRDTEPAMPSGWGTEPAMPSGRGTEPGMPGTADSALGVPVIAGTTGAALGMPDTASASPAVWGTASGMSDTADSAPATTDSAAGAAGTAPGAPGSAFASPAVQGNASGESDATYSAPGTTDTPDNAADTAGADALPVDGRASTYEQTKAELARLMSALTDGKGKPPPGETRDFESTPLPAPSRPTEDNLSNGTARPSQSIPTPPDPDEIPEPQRRPDIPDPGEPDPIPPAPPGPGPEPPDEPTSPTPPSVGLFGSDEPGRGPRNLAAAFGATSQITAETFAEVRAGTYIQTYADPPGESPAGTAEETAEPGAPAEDIVEPAAPADTAASRSASKISIAGEVETVGGAEVVSITGTSRRPSLASAFRSDEDTPADDSGTEKAEQAEQAGAEPVAAGQREPRGERSSGSTTIAGLLAEALAAYQEADENATSQPAAQDSRTDSRRDGPRDEDFERLFDWRDQTPASGRHRSPE